MQIFDRCTACAEVIAMNEDVSIVHGDDSGQVADSQHLFWP